MQYEKIKEVLAERGLKVKFNHRRLPTAVNYSSDLKIRKKIIIDTIKNVSKSKHEFEKDEKNNPKISSRGGYTIAKIIDKDNDEVSNGEAVCMLSENYSKHEGRVRSLGRAFSKLCLAKE